MLEKTITNALIALRANIIRERLDGLHHVNALLVARGVDPSKHIVRAKRKSNYSRKGMMQAMVLEALRDGPQQSREVASKIAKRRPDTEPAEASMRTARTLDRLRLAGLVKREGRLWGLAQ